MRLSLPNTRLAPFAWPPVARWLAVWRERRALAALPTERLDDLGLTRAEAAREAARAPWDLPGTRERS
ncbi:MAG: DUF1127 domain-containing protein [Pseudomonadota bacterium]